MSVYVNIDTLHISLVLHYRIAERASSNIVLAADRNMQTTEHSYPWLL